MSQPGVKKAKPMWRRAYVVAPIVVVIAAAAIALGTTFVPYGTEIESVSGDGLDPAAFASENYESKVAPEIEKNAVEWPTLIAAITKDAAAAGAEYGKRSSDSSPWAFPVTITGTFAKGEFGEIAIEGAEGTPAGLSVGMQTGPALTGTDIRDATGLATFGQFTNQTDFQQYGTELNTKVKETVLKDFNVDANIGKKVTVVGAFSWSNPDHVTIMPVSIEDAS